MARDQGMKGKGGWRGPNESCTYLEEVDVVVVVDMLDDTDNKDKWVRTVSSYCQPNTYLEWNSPLLQ